LLNSLFNFLGFTKQDLTPKLSNPIQLHNPPQYLKKWLSPLDYIRNLERKRSPSVFSEAKKSSF
jgi:hypothetical protein